MLESNQLLLQEPGGLRVLPLYEIRTRPTLGLTTQHVGYNGRRTGAVMTPLTATRQSLISRSKAAA